jgi:hypothetical protein
LPPDLFGTPKPAETGVKRGKKNAMSRCRPAREKDGQRWVHQTDPLPGRGLEELSSEISTGGWIALVLFVLVTPALGIGLMALVFISNRRGCDDPGRDLVDQRRSAHHLSGYPCRRARSLLPPRSGRESCGAPDAMKKPGR